MEAWLHSSIQWLLITLALPKVGLSAIFIVSLISATLLPLGSEPAVFAFVKVAPHMFWPAVLIATLGNTIGGVISFAMGSGAEKAYERWRRKHEAALRSHQDRAGSDSSGRPPSDSSRAGAQAGDQADTAAWPSGAGLEYSAALEQAADSPSRSIAAYGQPPARHVGGRWHAHVHYWADRLGPMALLFSWLPVVGDPLCAVAGWLRLAFWPSVLYMAMGKFVRYAVMTAALMWTFPNL